MEKKGDSKQLKQVNLVHRQQIHKENIKNEKKFESTNFKYDYTFSPYTCNNKNNYK